VNIKIIGSDYTFEGLNTSFFFNDDLGRGVLVDCGFTVFPELTRLNLRDKVDVVLISHPHPDHTGSLCTLGVYQRLYVKKKILVGGHEWVSEVFKAQGIQPDDFIPLPSDDPLNLKIIRTGHIPTYGHNNALFIANKILYSGDTNESILDTDYAREAKIIIHEATYLQTPYAHTTLEKLSAAAPEVKAKTWLTHIPTAERAELERLAPQMGFAGVCKNGQEIETE
jgi:ribonuclease BN (tRNA processing enzyme)